MKTAPAKSKISHFNTASIFSTLAQKRGAVWLDSSLMVRDKGRYSILADRPSGSIVGHSANLEECVNELNRLSHDNSVHIIGFFTYESTLPFCGEGTNSSDTLKIPLLHFFVYDSVLIFDHLTGECSESNPSTNRYDDLSDEILLECEFLEFENVIEPVVLKDEYFKQVQYIKRHIKEGDIYQANYTCRFDVQSNANPFRVYQNLRRVNPAPYSCYLNFGDYQVISSSPERMFCRNKDFITTCPIKGTIKSAASAPERKLQLEKLLNSAKDKAELLMIVDLMRNDLGKIAKIGSVEVSNLFSVEEYSSLFHLVTDVSARLKDGIEYSDIFAALMPGGSITGAPKKRAIEILKQHETTPRGIYTGCIGYINGDRADFNIAIRTMLHQNGTYQIHAGGGIVADSDPEYEYQEMMLKAKNLFRALGAKNLT